MSGVEWGALALALWLASEPEPARVPRQLPVAIVGCSAELTARLPALVSLEVDVLMRERGARRALPEVIAVRCAGGAAPVVIEVALAGTRRESAVALGGLAAEHRARALALAVAELVDALAASAASPPVSAPAPEKTAAAPASPGPPPVLVSAEPRAEPAAARPGAMLAGPAVEWLGKPATLVLGARLAYQHRSYAPWRGVPVTPLLSLAGSTGDAPSSAGHVAARIFAAGAHALLGAPLGGLRVEGGPGLRFGWARLAGEPLAGEVVEGRAVSGWWGGPEVCLRATAARGRLRPVVEVSGGWVVLPIRGLVDGGATAYAVQGPWLSAALQLAVELR